jgi:hypothetical protein
MARWAEACAVWLADWKRTGSAPALASATRYAQLHEAGVKRWVMACAREGWRRGSKLTPP